MRLQRNPFVNDHLLLRLPWEIKQNHYTALRRGQSEVGTSRVDYHEQIIPTPRLHYASVMWPRGTSVETGGTEEGRHAFLLFFFLVFFGDSLKALSTVTWFNSEYEDVWGADGKGVNVLFVWASGWQC